MRLNMEKHISIILDGMEQKGEEKNTIKEICTKDPFNYSFNDVCYIVMIYY
ncbi:hypothetical protein SAMN04487934_10556 [Eubacterium ruminantium]|nr:hypothetical protein SAMN04487934_10556 [Eubacterium ruminantium]